MHSSDNYSDDGSNKQSPQGKSGEEYRFSKEDLQDLQELIESEEEYRSDFSVWSVRSEVDYAHLRGIQSHYKHKNAWSILLMCCIVGMIIFQMIFLWHIGSGNLNFREYKWLLPAFVGQYFGQIIALSIYAVRSLFKDIAEKSKTFDL